MNEENSQKGGWGEMFCILSVEGRVSGRKSIWKDCVLLCYCDFEVCFLVKLNMAKILSMKL